MVSRTDRVRKAIIREISDLLQKTIKDPRLTGIVSITDAEVSSDFRHAKVFVSIYGSDEEQSKTMEALNSSSGFIKSEIGKRIQMRVTPDIKFIVDDSLERGARVTSLLDKIAKGEL